MLKIIGFIFKVTIFAAVVVVLANTIKLNGKTVSDQVKTGLAHAERQSAETVQDVKNWAGSLTEKEKRGGRRSVASTPHKKKPSPDGINDSEREKLRTLMRRLNSTQSNTEAKR